MSLTQFDINSLIKHFLFWVWKTMRLVLFRKPFTWPVFVWCCCGQKEVDFFNKNFHSGNLNTWSGKLSPQPSSSPLTLSRAPLWLRVLLNCITCVKSQIPLDMLTVISFQINPHTVRCGFLPHCSPSKGYSSDNQIIGEYQWKDQITPVPSSPMQLFPIHINYC